MLTLGDEDSWQTVVRSEKLKERGLKAETPARRLPRVSIFEIKRELDKTEIVDLVFAQNGKGLISEGEFKEEFVPLYRKGRRDHVKGAWVVKCSPRVRKRLIEQGQVYIGWDVCRVEDEAGVARCYRCQGYGHLAVH